MRRPFEININGGICGNNKFQELDNHIQHTQGISAFTIQLFLVNGIVSKEVLLGRPMLARQTNPYLLWFLFQKLFLHGLYGSTKLEIVPSGIGHSLHRATQSGNCLGKLTRRRAGNFPEVTFRI